METPKAPSVPDAGWPSGRFWDGLGHSWTVEPVTVNEFHCPPEWRVLPRTLSDFTFWIVRDGRGELCCADQTYPMDAGDLLLVPPEVRHWATHDPSRPLWVVTAHFMPVLTAGGPRPLMPEALPPVRRHLIDPQVFDAYFARLLASRALQPPAWQMLARALYLVLLAELCREDMEARMTTANRWNCYPVIAQVLLKLEAGGRYFVHPRALATACGFSPSHFSRLFRREFGCTPQHYLLRRRIERAQHLLLESDLSVQQVAQTLGYRDVYFFTRQFTALAGQPPAAYRRATRTTL